MSKTLFSVSFKDKDMITLSINREHFAKSVTNPKSFNNLIKEIKDMIYISLHFDDDMIGGDDNEG